MSTEPEEKKKSALDKLMDEWEKDCAIDPLKIESETIRQPLLHAKYSRIKTNLEIKHKMRKIEYDSFVHLKYQYYDNKLDIETLKELGWPIRHEKLTKEQKKYALQEDKDITKMKLKLIAEEEMLNLLDSILKEINSRSYTIKNHVNYVRFLAGLN